MLINRTAVFRLDRPSDCVSWVEQIAARRRLARELTPEREMPSVSAKSDGCTPRQAGTGQEMAT